MLMWKWLGVPAIWLVSLQLEKRHHSEHPATSSPVLTTETLSDFKNKWSLGQSCYSNQIQPTLPHCPCMNRCENSWETGSFAEKSCPRKMPRDKEGEGAICGTIGQCFWNYPCQSNWRMSRSFSCITEAHQKLWTNVPGNLINRYLWIFSFLKECFSSLSVAQNGTAFSIQFFTQFHGITLTTAYI